MKQPLFSIATPCYNSVKTIERTLKSVLVQECKDYEYIIVDGGSTDGTIDIIKRYEPLFEGRMHWKSEPDKGIYDAFNKGIERSTGVYCWNVNADDFIEPDALKNLKSIIEQQNQNNLPVISGAMRFLDDKGLNILAIQYSNQEKCKKSYEQNAMGVNHPATLVPRSIYLKNGAFDPAFKIIGDIDWFHRVYRANVPFLFTDTVVTNMCDGGISNQFNYKKSAKDRWLFLKHKYSCLFTRIYYFARWTKSFYSFKHKHNKLTKDSYIPK